MKIFTVEKYRGLNVRPAKERVYPSIFEPIKTRKRLERTSMMEFKSYPEACSHWIETSTLRVLSASRFDKYNVPLEHIDLL